ncbi:MAG: cytochrome C family protein [Nitrospirae bacterium]|nr:MAG: cytochrome C family protein [Nitrospirota bacterium]
MKKGIIFLPFILCFLLSAFNADIAEALENPHNINNSINCGNCHTTSLPGSTLPGWWTSQSETTGVCGQCHNATAAAGADVKGHSSANTSTQYGMWDTKCTNCHNPHTQRQNWRYKTASYLYTGASTDVTTSTLTTIVAGATNWTTDQWKGMILIPNVAYQAFNYRILGNTAAAVGAPSTITISTTGSDAIPLKYVKPGQTFGIVYGKLVKDVVNAKWVRFFRQTGANSFADGGATIDGICEVCHTQTKNADSTPRWRNTGNTGDHYAGQKCGGCHNHVEGFKATCGSCHGNPPVNTSTLVSSPGATGSTTPGAHNTHVTTKSIACASCHLNSVGSGSTHNNLPSPPQTVTIGFSLFSGTHLGGTYNGQTGVSYDTSEINTTYTNNNSKTCNNIYCHSTGQSLTNGNSATPTTYAAPVWDGTAACGTCHAATKAAVSTANSGSHADHVNNAGVSGCDACHTNATSGGTQYNSTAHVDNKINVAAGLSYSLGAAGNPGDGYGTCTTTCHSATTAAGTTPTWGAAGDCSTCHPLEPATGSHTDHIAASAACGNCHNGAVEGSNAGTAHLDTDIDVTNGYPANVAKHASGSGYSTCSAASCHINPALTVTTYVTTPTWGSTGNGCTACHAGANAITPNGPATGSHALHNDPTCTDCHNAGTTASTKPTTEHADNDIDTANVNYLDNKARGSVYTTCSTTNCHGTVSPTWGNNTGTTTCEKCHGSANTATGSGLFKITDQTTVSGPSVIHVSHLASSHNYSSDITCDQCHTVPGAANSIGHIDTALPAEVPMDGALARSGGLTPNYTSGTHTCSTMYCHGYSLSSNTPTLPSSVDVDPPWTITFLTGSSAVGNGNDSPGSGDCAKCHAYPPMNGASGTHTGKAATDCTTCHTHVNTQGTGFADVTKHINGTVEGGTCDSCHSYDTVAGTSWGKNSKSIQGYGAHAKHIDHIKARFAPLTLNPSTDTFGTGAAAKVCGTCHTNQSVDHSTGGGGTRTINFGNARYKEGSTNGTDGFSFIFGATNPTYNGVVDNSSESNPKSCSAVGCHYDTTPVWQSY